MANTNTRSGLAATAVATALMVAVSPNLAAEPGATPPDFAANDTAWVLSNADFIAVPGSPAPTRNDPAHPYVTNNVFRATGAQPTFRVADLTNPNIKPWAKAVMQQENDKVLAGAIPYSARASCMPAGVPGFMGFAVVEPMHFVQTPTMVTMIFSGDAQVRHIYLDVPHSANPKPSWYGEWVGHYEGDTLVVDTIGLNAKTYLDNFRTPHSEKLHVVERYKLIDDGNTLQATIRIEDPETFFEPWTVIDNFKRIHMPMHEEYCAENNQNLFDYHIPVANKPDF